MPAKLLYDLIEQEMSVVAALPHTSMQRAFPEA